MSPLPPPSPNTHTHINIITLNTNNFTVFYGNKLNQISRVYIN